ncbi:MAG: hypothetical protein IH571_05930 [Acholeplasmataceae bacterium]|nr:hypothetical protein [Acholeplasmataceae bacterium]
MRDVHKISLLALAYAFVLAIVSLIFFRDYWTWAVLGSAIALFNHSQMIVTTKGKYSAEKLILHIFQRYVLYVVVIAFAWFNTKDLGDSTIMQNTFIFLLLGFISVKIGAIVYATPLIKKTEDQEDKEADHEPDS